MIATALVTEGQPEWVNVVAFAAVFVGIVLIVVLKWRRMRKAPDEKKSDPPRD
ncbi:hypothetical protein HQQ80_06570 [Microbacteriaceae bacterium VKM Ac-2855]|nr:hypothetical protein [Microbacteriaceae bacterium VKM Ac-2855]